MKTPEQWIEEFEEKLNESGHYSYTLTELIQSIQKDAVESTQEEAHAKATEFYRQVVASHKP